jgi:hypothetical protein
MPTTEYIIKINGDVATVCYTREAAKSWKEFYELLLYKVEIDERDLLA